MDADFQPTLEEVKKMSHKYVVRDLEITLARIKKKKLEAYLKIARLEAELAETEGFILRRESEIKNMKGIVQEDTKEELSSTISLLNVLRSDTDSSTDTVGIENNNKKRKGSSKKGSKDFISTEVCRYCYKDHGVGDCKIFEKLKTNQRRNVIDSKRLHHDCSLKSHLAEESSAIKCKSYEHHENVFSNAIETFPNLAKINEINKKKSIALTESEQERINHVKKKFKDSDNKNDENPENKKDSKRNKTKYGNAFKVDRRQELRLNMQDGIRHSKKLGHQKVELGEKIVNRPDAWDGNPRNLDTARDVVLELSQGNIICAERTNFKENAFDNLQSVKIPNVEIKPSHIVKDGNRAQNSAQLWQTLEKTKYNDKNCTVCKVTRDSGDSHLDTLEKKNYARGEAFDEMTRAEGKLSTMHRLGEEMKVNSKTKLKNCDILKTSTNKENELNEANAIGKKNSHCRLSQICSLLYPNVRR